MPATPKRHAAGARWLEAAIRVPIAAAERIGTLLVEAGSQGVITGVRELARGDRRRTHETVRGFFPSHEPVRARLAVRAALRRSGKPSLARAAVRWRELDAQLWEMDWREHFQPVVAGRTLVVVPPWNRSVYLGRRRVVIHPGMAFGTGQHATTRSCLEAIEQLATPPPPRALDVGTGTGVLAIALAKLGVRRVLAIDTDPQAIVAARGNLRRNAVGPRVRLTTKPLAVARLDGRSHRARGDARGRYPLIVANLYVDALVGLEPALASAVTTGGHLITSGVLRAQQARLREAFARAEESGGIPRAQRNSPAGMPPHLLRARWKVERVTRCGAWVTTVFQRNATSGRGDGVRAATRRS